MTKTTITTGFVSSFKDGDRLQIQISNSFWKTFYHWVLRKDLKRSTKYTITAIDGTTLEIKDE